MKLGHEAWGWRFDVRLGEDGGGRVQDEGDALPRVSEFPEMAGDAETIDWDRERPEYDETIYINHYLGYDRY